MGGFSSKVAPVSQGDGGTPPTESTDGKITNEVTALIAKHRRMGAVQENKGSFDVKDQTGAVVYSAEGKSDERGSNAGPSLFRLARILPLI